MTILQAMVGRPHDNKQNLNLSVQQIELFKELQA